MNNSVEWIPVWNLTLAFIPVLAVLIVIYRWRLDGRGALYAVARMLIQLLLVGYVLLYIFEAENAPVIAVVLAVMLFVSSWIALRPVAESRRKLYGRAFLSIAVGGGATLILITQGVLQLEPWFWPRYVVPLAGMIFASAMNAVSLAAERFEAESLAGSGYQAARRTAFRAGLIPITNSLLAVGLVSLPGMMTGQILSGVSPLVAARYQIMVMCMIFGAAGISSAIYLALLKSYAEDLKVAPEHEGGVRKRGECA
jgi:putative ABC transport system permease protein